MATVTTAGRVAGVTLFDELIGTGGKVLDRYAFERAHVGQRGIEGKQNLIPYGDVAGGLPVFVHVAGFEITEVAEVMDRTILTATR